MAHHRALGGSLSGGDAILASAEQADAEQDEREEEGREAQESLEHGVRPVPRKFGSQIRARTPRFRARTL